LIDLTKLENMIQKYAIELTDGLNKNEK